VNSIAAVSGSFDLVGQTAVFFEFQKWEETVVFEFEEEFILMNLVLTEIGILSFLILL
jgi:hypothetical protein